MNADSGTEAGLKAAALTDAELSALVAEKVDSWRIAFPAGGKPHKETERGGILLPYRWVNERTHERRMDLPPYATSVDAVLPLIGDRLFSVSNAQQREPGCPREWQVNLWSYRGVGPYKGKDASFPRAACLALLAAHAAHADTQAGARKTTPSGAQPPDGGTTAATKGDVK